MSLMETTLAYPTPFSTESCRPFDTELRTGPLGDGRRWTSDPSSVLYPSFRSTWLPQLRLGWRILRLHHVTPWLMLQCTVGFWRTRKPSGSCCFSFYPPWPVLWDPDTLVLDPSNLGSDSSRFRGTSGSSLRGSPTDLLMSIHNPVRLPGMSKLASCVSSRLLLTYPSHTNSWIWT